ncbi:hypothetical protein QBC41DRAFT_235996 [Cercophora samala]|uniref:Uncharacterized protein n=1 Tax=Cercophora samala TaxID=330535 RepID=A0AA40D343_9PEZI|nr:hypothetical protein QBC41DRAFT_235996 [Cercophora samala]
MLYSSKRELMGLVYAMCQYGATKMATYHLNAAASRLEWPTKKRGVACSGGGGIG